MPSKTLKFATQYKDDKENRGPRTTKDEQHQQQAQQQQQRQHQVVPYLEDLEEEGETSQLRPRHVPP